MIQPYARVIPYSAGNTHGAPWATVAPWAARCLHALRDGLRQIAQRGDYRGE